LRLNTQHLLRLLPAGQIPFKSGGYSYDGGDSVPGE